MEQPEVYNTKEELIKWLEEDLKEQRKNYFSYTENPVDEMELEDFLFINIGIIDTDCDKIIIGDINNNCKKIINVNFKLNIQRIITDLTIRYKNTLDEEYSEKKKINYKINCKGVIFNAYANFSNADIREADFSDVVFNKEVNFIKSKFYRKCKFTNTIFKEIADFSNTQFYYKNEHDKKFIHNSIYFYNNEFDKSLIFKNSTFDLSVIIDNSTFKNTVDFNNCIFNESLNITNSKFKNHANFKNSTFNILKIEHVKFYKWANFYCSNFKKIANIINVEFNEYTNFMNSIFEEAYISYILKTDSNPMYNFANSKINKKLSIYNIEKEYINIYLDNIKFENEYSIISIRNIENPIRYLSFKDVIIRGIINIQNVEVETADFKGSVINRGLVNPVNFKIDNFANRESALFLKNEAYARRNVIDALEYKSKEMKMHRKELLNKPNKTSKDWFDIISISLSSLYSNNGQNWGKSLFMTILITFVFFNIFYLPDLSQSNIEPYFYKDYFSNLIKYFIPTDYEQIKYYADASIGINIFIKIFGAIIYFVGKIMFWYGSVQTVQAFRKFSKGA